MPIEKHSHLSDNALSGSLSLVPWKRSPDNVEESKDYLYFLVTVPFRGGVDTHHRITANEAFDTAMETILYRRTNSYGARDYGLVRVLGITLDKAVNVWSDQEVRRITTGLAAKRASADAWLEKNKVEGIVDLLLEEHEVRL